MKLTELEKEMLDIMITNIPVHPPLKPGGEVTIKELYPDLSNEELDYVMEHYTGEMIRE